MQATSNCNAKETRLATDALTEQAIYHVGYIFIIHTHFTRHLHATQKTQTQTHIFHRFFRKPCIRDFQWTPFSLSLFWARLSIMFPPHNGQRTKNPPKTLAVAALGQRGAIFGHARTIGYCVRLPIWAERICVATKFGKFRYSAEIKCTPQQIFRKFFYLFFSLFTDYRKIFLISYHFFFF